MKTIEYATPYFDAAKTMPRHICMRFVKTKNICRATKKTVKRKSTVMEYIEWHNSNDSNFHTQCIHQRLFLRYFRRFR